MTPNERRKLEKLQSKLNLCRQTGDYLSQMRLSKEIEKLKENDTKQQQTTLFNLLRDYTPEKRRAMTLKMITAVGMSDMLLSAVIDIESAFRDLGVIDIPVLSEIEGIAKRLREVTSTISKVHNTFLDEHYCDVVDGIEERVTPMMKNYILNEMNKWDKR